VIKWIGQDDNPTTTSTYQSFERVNKLIEEATGGRLVIQSNEGGAIVPADTEIDGVQRGVLDVAHNGPILWVSNLPAAPPFSTTVGGPTALEYYMWYMWGEGFDLMQEMFDNGGYDKVMPIAAVCREPETFLYTTFPVEGPEDLAGKKMRLLGDEAEIFGKLKVAAVATPSPELYEAIQRGVIDGFQHSSLAVDWNMGFQEVVDYAYVSPVRQPTDMYIYIVNKESWAALPDDLKVIVQELWWAEGIRHYAEWTYKNTTAAQDWIQAGVNVLPAPKSLEDELIKLATEFYQKRAAEDPFYAKLMDSLFSWRDRYDATYPRL
jgi:TRAP-type mannitol/chloroaromatic compound transport system substrate-binding protein